MNLTPSAMSADDLYKIISAAVVPRPIAWVSTKSASGVHNLAPFSFFTVASSEPPMLCLSIGPGEAEREGMPKDTLANIRDTGEFVVNAVPYALVEQMQKSAQNYAPETDEFAETCLSPAESSVVQAPGVAESPIQLECRLDRIIPLGNDHLVIGEVVHIRIQDEFYQNGRIDLEKLQPVGRLAGNYVKVEKLFSI